MKIVLWPSYEDSRKDPVSQVSISGSVDASGSGFQIAVLIGGDTGTVRQPSATSSVTGNGQVGGFIGSEAGGMFEPSFAGGTVSKNTDSGGLVGRNFLTVQVFYWETEATTTPSLPKTDRAGGNERVMVVSTDGGATQSLADTTWEGLTTVSVSDLIEFAIKLT